MANKIKTFPIDSVGYRVTKLAEKKGLKKNDLYKIMMPEGVSEDLDSQNHAVNAALASGTMGINKLKHLAEYFHVSTDYLLGLEDDNGLSEDAALTMQLLTTGEKEMLSRILSRTEDVRAILQYIIASDFQEAVSVPQAEQEYKRAEEAAAAADSSAPIAAGNNALKKKSDYLNAVNVLRMNKHDAVHEFENLINKVVPTPAPQDPEKK